VVGDRTELATLTEFFDAAGRDAWVVHPRSVKAQIGHTKCAAGMAGLIKAAFAGAHRCLASDQERTDAESGVRRHREPVRVAGRGSAMARRRASRGGERVRFGGTNFHAVIASHGAALSTGSLVEWPAELFVVRAKDDGGAKVVLDALASATVRKCRRKLRDLAASLQLVNREDPVRLAIAHHARLTSCPGTSDWPEPD